MGVWFDSSVVELVELVRSLRGLLTEPIEAPLPEADWLSWRMVMFNPPELPVVGSVTPAIEKISNGCDSFAFASFNSFSYRRKERQRTKGKKRAAVGIRTRSLFFSADEFRRH